MDLVRMYVFVFGLKFCVLMVKFGVGWINFIGYMNVFECDLKFMEEFWLEVG